jgi:hypothetical protein
LGSTQQNRVDFDMPFFPNDIPTALTEMAFRLGIKNMPESVVQRLASQFSRISDKVFMPSLVRLHPLIMLPMFFSHAATPVALLMRRSCISSMELFGGHGVNRVFFLPLKLYIFES